MRLIDQRRIGKVPVIVSGAHPDLAPDDPRWRASLDLEDATLFPPPVDLPGRVDSPASWPWEWGLLVASRVDPTGRWVLGEVIPGVPEPELRLRQRRLCVWSLEGGALCHAFPEQTLDAHWTDTGLIDVRWAEEKGFTTATLTTAPPSPRVVHSKTIGPCPNLAAGASAQALSPTLSRARWVLWSAGHGEQGFELLSVESGEIRRLYATPETHLDPQSPVLSPDLCWLAFRVQLARGDEVTDMIAMVDLREGSSSFHALDGGRADAPELRFAASGSELTIEHPDVSSEYVSSPRRFGRFPLPLAAILKLSSQQ